MEASMILLKNIKGELCVAKCFIRIDVLLHDNENPPLHH